MKLKEELTDQTIKLRRPLFTDKVEIARAVQRSVREISPWMGWCHADYDASDALGWLETAQKGWEQGSEYNFVIIDGDLGEIIGGCGLNQINSLFRFANLGYWVRSDRAGEGIAVRAVHLLARFGFEDLGFNRLEIVVAEGNRRSIRVAEKSGATLEGLLRNRLVVRDKFLDAFMFSLIPTDLEKKNEKQS
jgi:RimJ/RimL family protein N-acetyltransferase